MPIFCGRAIKFRTLDRFVSEEMNEQYMADLHGYLSLDPELLSMLGATGRGQCCH
jgi:hypothetical protein